MDILPTILHLASLVTREPIAYNPQDVSGHSLFANQQDRVVVSAGCFNNWGCNKREVVFADDNYYILLKPNKQPNVEIYPAKDLAQQQPLAMNSINATAIQAIYEQAPQLHPWGHILQSILISQIPGLRLANKTAASTLSK